MTVPVEVVIQGRDETGGAFASAQGGLSKIGQIAAGILTSQVFTKLAQGVKDFAVSIVAEAREAAQVQAQLNAVITSTGGAAGVTAEMVNELADSLQYQSKFTDDAIISGENMLLTFTNIGKDVFPQATQTILDMSTALGQDVTNSAIQLGKALNDPIQGVTALRRVGVQLSDEQENQVKAFMAVNDIAGAQGVILGELAKEFGGSAKSQVTAMDNLKKRFDNMKETLGTALLPTIDKFGQILDDALSSPEAQEALENITKWLGDNVPKALDLAIELFGRFRDSSADMGAKVAQFIKPLMPAFRSIADVMSRLMPFAAGVAKLLGEKLVSAGKELSGKVIPFLTVKLYQFANWFRANEPLIKAFIQKAGEAFRKFADAIVGFWSVVEPILSGLFTIILNLATFIMAFATGDWQTAWDSIKVIVVTVFSSIGEAIVNLLNWIAGLMGGSLAQIKAQWTTNWNLLKSILSQVWSIIKSTISGALNSIKSFFISAWANIISGVVNFGANLRNMLVSSVQSAYSSLLGYINVFSSIGSTIITRIVSGLQSNLNKLKDYLAGLIQSMVGYLLGSGGGGGSNPVKPPIGTKALGGNIDAGRGYLVGEVGQELFIPQTDGYLIPNNQLGKLGGGRGRVTNNYYNAHITIVTATQQKASMKGIA